VTTEADRRLSLALHAHKNRRADDPLARYFFPSPIHRSVIEAFGRGLRTHHRAANIGAKTGNCAAAIVASARDMVGLVACTREGGAPSPRRMAHAPVRLPKFGRPTVSAVLVQSYDGQVDSSQKWIITHLGNHQWEPAYVNRGKNIIGTFWVRPDGWRNDDPQTWSRITFFSQEAARDVSVRGQRWDAVWADEPPRRDFWEECLKNARYHIISETPVFEDEWGWIAEEFDGCLGLAKNGRIEFVSTLWDNGYLTAEQLREQEEKYGGKPEYKARMLGEYVNLSGSCPFGEQYSWLQQMLEWAEPGQPHELDPVFETWRERHRHGQYMVLLDPSAGIRPTPDDPIGGDRCSALCVEFLPDGGLADVGRFLGWMPPHMLARLGRKMASYYNDALLIHEVNGIGEACFPELDGYVNLFRESAIEHAEHAMTYRYGWYQTAGLKAALVGSLIRSLAERSYDIPSAEAIRSLLAIRQDGRGKLLRSPGQNHEDLILHGMAAYIGAHPSYRPAPHASVRKPATPTEEFFQKLSGEMGRRVRPTITGGVVDRWQRGR